MQYAKSASLLNVNINNLKRKKMNFIRETHLLLLLVFVVGCSETASLTKNIKKTIKQKAVGMVVTANPLATEAGLQVLRAGGSAADAAVAVEATLSLVEPQSSGLAGGGLLVYYDASTKEVEYYNGREKAPAGATKSLFLNEKGEPIPRKEAKNSGRSIGVPGAVALLNLTHKNHGKLAWNKLFDFAQKLSIGGFPVSPRMNHSINTYSKYFHRTKAEGPLEAYEYLFTDEGLPLPVGYILKNPEYAETLKIIANDPADFYRGKIAAEITKKAQEMPNGGTLTVEDFANFTAEKSAALCNNYRNMKLCGSGLPSSWVTVSMVMSLLNEAPDFSPEGANDPANWTLLAEALRIAYADNNEFIADGNFVDVPLKGLMSNAYIKERAKLISRVGANPNIKAGNPWAYQNEKMNVAYGKDATLDDVGTTHFVIADAQGNVVSMTATVEGYFGSLRMSGGMILNNQLTDFSFKYEDKNGKPIANALAPGKRPRSSMSPTILLDENGDFLMAVGSPGGRNIISYVAKVLVGVIRWGLSPQEAIDLPNMVAKTD